MIHRRDEFHVLGSQAIGIELEFLRAVENIEMSRRVGIQGLRAANLQESRQ